MVRVHHHSREKYFGVKANENRLGWEGKEVSSPLHLDQVYSLVTTECDITLEHENNTEISYLSHT